MAESLTLEDFFRIAGSTLKLPVEQIRRETQIPLAESALAAPLASFSGIEFYKDPVERAAICCSRLIRNMPLPNGNKRVACACMREMLRRIGLPWPWEDEVEIANVLEALAARDMSEQDFVRWVKRRTELEA
jgi:death-on-curing protein